MSVKSSVEELISNNLIAVFSKSYCPYCIKAKQLLDKLGAKYVAWELDQLSEGSDIQNYLQQKTGQRTVPNIFINQKHMGGCDDLHSLHSNGELAKLIKA